MTRTIFTSAVACLALLAMSSVASAQFRLGGVIQRGGQILRNTVVNPGSNIQNLRNNYGFGGQAYNNGYQQNYNNGYRQNYHNGYQYSNNNGFQQTGQWSEWRPVNPGNNGYPVQQAGGTRPSGFPQSGSTGNGPSGFPQSGATGNGPTGFPQSGLTGNGPSGFPQSGATGGRVPRRTGGGGQGGVPQGFPSP